MAVQVGKLTGYNYNINPLENREGWVNWLTGCYYSVTALTHPEAVVKMSGGCHRRTIHTIQQGVRGTTLIYCQHTVSNIDCQSTVPPPNWLYSYNYNLMSQHL